MRSVVCCSISDEYEAELLVHPARLWVAVDERDDKGAEIESELAHEPYFGHGADKRFIFGDVHDFVAEKHVRLVVSAANTLNVRVDKLSEECRWVDECD